MLRKKKTGVFILTVILFYTLFTVIGFAGINLSSAKEKTQYREKIFFGKMRHTLKISNLTQNNARLSQNNEDPLFVYSFTGGGWQFSNVCNISKKYLNDQDFYLTQAHSEAGSVNLFVHNPEYDAISGTIKQRRSFESENVDAVMSMLRKDQQLSLIDIGANVGIYALSAALFGRQVIAIDAAMENIQHICASVEYGHFSNRVAIIYNALSDSHGKVDFKHGVKGDFGLGHVNADGISSKMETKFKNYFDNGRTDAVETVKLDDLLSLPHLAFMKNIFIKIDVEGHEHRVLLGAKQFMKQKIKSVRGIVMEWQWFSDEAESTIRNLMAGWNFAPYKLSGMTEPLKLNQTMHWPNDVLWLPKYSAKNKVVKYQRSALKTSRQQRKISLIK
ncbi:uncharacterized protein [Mytilus edulis]|uniref:uncharacterized protein n=1 Tax=Mytilus edulis TaxID=6550 RepID=UPI0039EE8AF5